MRRYIDAEVVKLAIRRFLMPNVDFDGTVRVEDAERYFLKLLDDTPPADVREVKRGEWVFGCVHQDKKFYKCTNCHHAFPFNNVNFCPNCGADMRKEEENDL